MTQTPLPIPPGLDPNYVFSELMPLLATVAGVLAVGIGLRWILRTSLGEALAQRIRDGLRSGRRQIERPASERAELEGRVSLLQEQAGELAERLEFTERLLAGQRERSLGRGE